MFLSLGSEPRLTLSQMDHVLGCGSLWLMGKEDLDRGVVEAAVVTCMRQQSSLVNPKETN
jgi:hypothetical protein